MLPKNFAAIRSGLKRAVRAKQRYYFELSEGRYIVSNGDVAFDLTDVLSSEAQGLLHLELLSLNRGYVPDTQPPLFTMVPKWTSRATVPLEPTHIQSVKDPKAPLTFLAQPNWGKYEGAGKIAVAVQAQYIELTQAIYSKPLEFRANPDDARWPIGLFIAGDPVGAIMPVELLPGSTLPGDLISLGNALRRHYVKEG